MAACGLKDVPLRFPNPTEKLLDLAFAIQWYIKEEYEERKFYFCNYLY